MAKKFSDLKHGDSIYYLLMNFIEDGYQENVLADDFEESFEYFSTKTIDNFLISFDKKSFNKSVYTSKYSIYATTLESLKKASKKYIEEELGVVQKEIDKQNKKIDDLNERKESITKLLQ